jgi:flagellar biogenesis protein FliO
LQQQITNLKKQVADLTNLSSDQQEQVKKFQEQMEADSSAALQAKSAAHQQGLEMGAAIGTGAMALFFTLIFGLRKLVRSKKLLARVASA